MKKYITVSVYLLFLIHVSSYCQLVGKNFIGGGDKYNQVIHKVNFINDSQFVYFVSYENVSFPLDYPTFLYKGIWKKLKDTVFLTVTNSPTFDSLNKCEKYIKETESDWPFDFKKIAFKINNKPVPMAIVYINNDETYHYTDERGEIYMGLKNLYKLRIIAFPLKENFVQIEHPAYNNFEINLCDDKTKIIVKIQPPIPKLIFRKNELIPTKLGKIYKNNSLKEAK